ncbi:MAG TPA: hypothetical protein VFY66_11110 [Anaerolineales bacterium]|nr:hypothetical protein [Anaerolineales bacterium]
MFVMTFIAFGLMQAAMTQLNLSARAYHRILKLARTIADLARSEEIQSVDLAEALQYSPKLMMNKSCAFAVFLCSKGLNLNYYSNSNEGDVSWK